MEQRAAFQFGLSFVFRSCGEVRKAAFGRTDVKLIFGSNRFETKWLCEFSTCSGFDGNPGTPWSSWLVAAPSGYTLQSGVETGTKTAVRSEQLLNLQ